MSRRARRAPSRVYSISCTDAEWERVRRLAERRGMSISRYFVERGLTVELEAETEPAPRLVLDEAEQRALSESVARIAECMVASGSEEAVLTRIRNALAYLAEFSMRELVRSGREGELRRFLVILVGEGPAAATVEQVLARMRSEPRGG